MSAHPDRVPGHERLEMHERLEIARGIMDEFAVWTGLGGSAAPPRRYLWTDAFAVCNYLGLHAATGSDRYRACALELVDQVHGVLGRHRDDDPRSGWISGLSEEEGARHPTAGGLRIGKPLPERRPGEPYDSVDEWNRDGQYYHYLTRWMHALDRVWRSTGDVRYHRQAVELASWAHEAFRAREDGGTHLRWKISIDGSRPLVPSYGHHDPLDGLLTLGALVVGAPSATASSTLRRLAGPLSELDAMCRGRSWATDDPLGAGGLLSDVFRVHALTEDRIVPRTIRHAVLRDAGASLELVATSGPWTAAASRRIPFRELGLSIGIHAAARAIGVVVTAAGARGREGSAEREGERVDDAAVGRLTSTLREHGGRADEIERFWLNASNRSGATWRDHREINAVMLATSLEPSGLLGA